MLMTPAAVACMFLAPPLAPVRSRYFHRHVCMSAERHDERWMSYALRLSERGRLTTAPNPWCGAARPHLHRPIQSPAPPLRIVLAAISTAH